VFTGRVPIAYDRTPPSPKPEAWNKPLVLGISSVLGTAGVVASFGLFYLAERVFHLDRSVSVASVTVNREVRILDLAKGPPGINPFITESLRWDVEIQSLLIAFGEEMSLPLERDDDPAHYRPCQRLADYIRDTKYDGIRYPSALNPDGTNVV
jgi:hypothetical protein